MTITDPRDIPDLLAWYSAEAETGYTNGAGMTGWTDLSGNGNHAGVSGTAPTWQGAAGPSGGAAVDLGAGFGCTMTLPDMFTGLAAAEMAIHLKSDSASSNNGGWGIGEDQDGNGTHYPYLDGDIYDGFGLADTQRQQFAPGVAITSWHRYSVYSASSDWQAFHNGSSVHTATADTTPTFDPTPTLGIQNGGSRTFNGFVSCAVFYGRKLTPAERADLDAWLVMNPSGGAVDAPGLTLAGTIPAIEATMSLRSYTRTDTSNRRAGRVRGGYAIHADNTDPVTLPANAATRRDKALWYPDPDLVDGKPT